MTAKEKNQLIKYISQLHEEERYEDIAEILLGIPETKKDYKLSCLLARDFICLGSDKDAKFYEAAEILLSQFAYEGFGKPEWHYLSAQALYLQGRTAEAFRHLEKISEAAKFSEDIAEEYKDALEMLEICRSEVEAQTVIYTPVQRRAVEDHIDAYFGEISKIITDDEPMGIKTDIAVIEPDEFHDYYTLVTIGMGAYCMNVPEQVEQDRLERAELVMYMPTDWDPDSEKHSDCWVFKYMRGVARMPFDRKTWLGYGHMVTGGMPLNENTKLCGTMLISIQEAAELSLRCYMPDGNDVVFYQLFPLYKEEMDFKVANGTNALIDKMPHIRAIYDPVRENVCKNYDCHNGAELMRGEIDMLKSGDIGKMCAASRMISRDGCRVGFMKRILFDSESELSENDSGWLMLSGEESEEYLANPFNLELCSLNTICNIDSDILPFLSMPYGTEIARSFDGELFVIENPQSGDDEPPRIFS